MAIIGVPEDFPGDLRKRSDEELAMAESNLIQLSWQTSLGGIVTEGEHHQAESLLAVIRSEISRRKAAA